MSSGAEKYENSSKVFQTKFCLTLLRKLPTPIQEGWRVLDMGCGTGTNTEIVAKLVGENGLVLALDPNSERIKYFQERAKLNRLNQVVIRNVGAELGPYCEYSAFNLAIANTVLHWIEEKTLRIAVNKVYENLVPGGYFAICGPNMRPDEGDFHYLFFNGLPDVVRQKIYSRVHARSLLWYAELLQDVGFDIVDSGYAYVESRYKDVKDMAQRLTGTFEGIVDFGKYLTTDIIERSGIYVLRKDGSFSGVTRNSYLIEIYASLDWPFFNAYIMRSEGSNGKNGFKINLTMLIGNSVRILVTRYGERTARNA